MSKEKEFDKLKQKYPDLDYIGYSQGCIQNYDEIKQLEARISQLEQQVAELLAGMKKALDQR